MSKKTNEPITLDALPPGSVAELQGKQYPTHPGLLALAHAHGVETITTDLMQYNDGEAIIKAKVTGTRGTFEAHGDASPSNVSRNIANAVIRMAETRAVNRCLRLYLGIGATTAEELPPDAFQGRSGGSTRKAPPKPAQSKPRAKAATVDSKWSKGDTVTTSNGNTGTIFWIGGEHGDRVGVRWGDGDDDTEWTYMRFLSAPQQSRASARPVEPNYPVFDDDSVASTTIGTHPEDLAETDSNDDTKPF